MLTYYRRGRLFAKIFIKLGWAILIAIAALVVLALTTMFIAKGGLGGLGLVMLPGTLLTMLPLVFVCMVTVLFGHVALAVFDLADASRKTD